MRKLSILELGLTRDVNDKLVIEQTINLAKKADKLGYTRFWVGEHQDGECAWRGPEILISCIAGNTNRIKVGSGGVLLPLNSPLRVAQNFKFMATLFPNRIDLGIARGFARSFISGDLLNNMSIEEAVANHSHRIKSLVRYIRNEKIVISETETLINSPLSGEQPEIWILGSSGNGLALSAEENLKYSFSLLHSQGLENKNPETQSKPFLEYQKKYKNENFICSGHKIAAGIVLGKDKNESERLSNKFNTGFLTINIKGDKKKCFDDLNALFEKYLVSEVMLYFFSDSIKHKEFCYETFAELFELT